MPVFHVGQSFPVTCPKGYQAKGTAAVTCRSDQTWSPVSSVCESEYTRGRHQGSESNRLHL